MTYVTPVSLIHMIMLITCLRDPSVDEFLKSRVKFEVFQILKSVDH
jgi:hypothetical protein